MSFFTVDMSTDGERNIPGKKVFAKVYFWIVKLVVCAKTGVDRLDHDRKCVLVVYQNEKVFLDVDKDDVSPSNVRSQTVYLSSSGRFTSIHSYFVKALLNGKDL